MVRIDHNKLEKNLGFKLKKNTFVLGLDTATTTGIAMIDVTSKKIEIETDIMKIPSPQDSDNKSDEYQQKLELLLKWVREFKKRIIAKPKNKRILILENSYLGFNAWTYGFLKMFGGLIYAELYDYFEHIELIFPTSARKRVGFKSLLPKGTKSKDKKAEIMTWVSKMVEDEIKDDNIADAIVLALAGLREVENEN